MAAKLYECRDTAKRFFKDQYPDKIQPYTDLVKAVMKANQIEEIPALLLISKTETYQDNPMGQMMFMAAVTDLMEPENVEMNSSKP